MIVLGRTEILSKEENNIEEEISKSAKSLVLYFSATGNTKNIAKYIKETTNSDIIEIQPKEKYTNADLNYSNSECRANKEQNDINSRPEILNKFDLEQYDVIYLGYPIWWSDVPKIILTLLDSYNLDGKTIIPFCTSGSTGITQSMNTLKSYKEKINFIDGQRFESNATKKEVESWIDTLKISEIKEESNMKICIKIGDKVLTATLEDNSSAKAFKEKLDDGDLTISMSDYSNFEKVGSLGFNLPTNDTQISTDYGDIILYQGNNITIYYDKNSWNFTKLGHIDNITQDELKSILGKDDVIVTFSTKN